MFRFRKGNSEQSLYEQDLIDLSRFPVPAKALHKRDSLLGDAAAGVSDAPTETEQKRGSRLGENAASDVSVDMLNQTNQPVPETDDEYSERVASQVSVYYGRFAVVYGLISKLLKTTGVILSSLPIVSQAVAGVATIWDTILSAWGIKKEGKWTRGIKTFVGLASVGIGIASLAAPAAALIIFVVSASLGLAQDLWTFGAMLVSRASGSWRAQIDSAEQDEKRFYDLLAADVENFKKLESARQYARSIQALRVYDDKITQVEARIESRKKEIAESIPTSGKSKNQLTQEIAHGIEQDEALKKLLQEKQTIIEDKKRDRHYDIVSTMKEDFVDKLTPDQREIIELDKKISKKRDDLRARDSAIASGVVGFGVTAVALIGTAFMFTPLLPIGAIMLLSVAVYTVAKTFDFPFKWASKINNFFFGPKAKPIAEIEKTVLDVAAKKENELTQQSKAKKQQAHQLTNAAKMEQALHAVPHAKNGSVSQNFTPQKSSMNDGVLKDRHVSASGMRSDLLKDSFPHSSPSFGASFSDVAAEARGKNHMPQSNHLESKAGSPVASKTVRSGVAANASQFIDTTGNDKKEDEEGEGEKHTPRKK